MSKAFRWNDLLSWLRSKGCFVKSPTDGSATHLIMTGGRLRVPRELESAFRVEYAKSVYAAGDWQYIVELKTEPTFKMLSELDMVVSSDAVDMVRSSISRVLFRNIFWRSMADIFDARDMRMLVADVEPAQDGPGRTRLGYHVVWEGLYVNKRLASDLRALLLYRMSEAEERDEEVARFMDAMKESMKHVLDPVVYADNGLRMLGSRKAFECPCDVDGSGPRPSCERCGGCGKMDLGRAYRPYLCISSAGEEEDAATLQSLVKLPADAVTAFSIRAPEGVVAAAEPALLTDPATPLGQFVKALRDEKRAVSKKAKKRCRPKAMDDGLIEHNSRGDREDCGDDCDSGRGDYGEGTDLPSFEKLSVASVAWTELVNFFQRRGERVRAVLQPARGGMPLVADTTSHMCRNKEGKHRLSKIFYIVYPHIGRVQQRCHCRNGKVWRVGGVACMAYTSPPLELTPSEMLVMARISGDRATVVPTLDRASLMSLSMPDVDAYAEAQKRAFLDRPRKKAREKAIAPRVDGSMCGTDAAVCADADL